MPKSSSETHRPLTTSTSNRPVDTLDDSESESLRNGEDDQFHDETNTDVGDASTAVQENLTSSKKPRSKSKKSGKKKKKKGKSNRDSTTKRGSSGNANTEPELDDDGYPKHKYSTADQSSTSKCKKYLWILFMFILVALFMYGMSKLMEYFFYNKKTDNTDITSYVRDPNSTFPADKFDIDSACSRGQVAADEGAMCKNACMPVYYDCCDPFNEFDLYASYQTVPPSFDNTTQDDDKYPVGLDASDFNNRNNSTNSTLGANNSTNPTANSTKPKSNSTGIVSDSNSTLTTKDKNLTDTSNTTDSNSTTLDNNSTTTDGNLTDSNATTGTTRFIRKYKVRRRYEIETEYNDYDEEIGRNMGDIDIPLTVAPVWWNDQKDKLDAQIAARANQTCSLSNELEGCVRYAKCQAALGKVDPAPANLPKMCALDTIQMDPGGCQDICQGAAACCYATDDTNCLAQHFDVCLDYAPCQNLRAINGDADPTSIVPAASQTLDHDCFYQQLPCIEECKLAECCSNSNSLCFRNNFIPCLTYAPCNNITNTHIYIPPQFNYLNKPPDEILKVCARPTIGTAGTNNYNTVVIASNQTTCKQLCDAASCCNAKSASDNCFMDDPLGCLAWEQQCQILLEFPNM